jgi:hypothetical protein
MLVPPFLVGGDHVRVAQLLGGLLVLEGLQRAELDPLGHMGVLEFGQFADERVGYLVGPSRNGFDLDASHLWVKSVNHAGDPGAEVAHIASCK